MEIVVISLMGHHEDFNITLKTKNSIQVPVEAFMGSWTSWKCPIRPHSSRFHPNYMGIFRLSFDNTGIKVHRMMEMPQFLYN